ncbi:ABC transporter ATP-binding protein [Atopobacter sp. AH10]|uniref:ABC transporter ATP-binding protein n=1 Tax=Atopobacter sp. AH10 TaxID=2315861 RepID=UPI000EF2095A|nr:ABC transporter ATP-binding protein [Atopobacter sp. AH10]RLK64247.1 ABC transporter ATP-binding protein [Atopobacter sp. AH10]
MNSYRQYRKLFFKNNRLVVFLTVVIYIFTALINLGISVGLQLVFDYMAGKSSYSFLMILLAFVGLLFVTGVKAIGEYHFYPRFLEKAMNQYKEVFIRQLLEKNLADYNAANSATYLSIFTNDCERIQENYLKKIFDAILQVVMLVGSLSLMLYYSPLLTLIAILISMVPVFASVSMANQLAEREETVARNNENYVSLTKDILNGMSVVKSFKAEEEVAGLYEDRSKTLEKVKKNREQSRILVNSLGEGAGLIAQFGVLLAGAWLVHQQSSTLTAGMVLAFTNLMNFVLQPISVLPQLIGQMKGAQKLIVKMADQIGSTKRDEDKTDLLELGEGIRLENVSFAYTKDEHLAVDSLNLNLLAGKSYAIVGGSGSGKSSLIHLLMGYYTDYQGQILVNGKELRQVSKESLYDKLTLIQQSVFIFDSSIKDNITLFKDFPASEIDRVVELAGLSPLVEEKGLAYSCGENGNRLSGGEKQRIAIARSLLKHAEVLLVDEATSALDNETAATINQSILDLKDMLRVVITHRLDEQSLKQYDQILVMKKGRLIEVGSYEELMAEKGYFYSLYTVSK